MMTYYCYYRVIDWLVKSGFQQEKTKDQGADGMHVVQQKHNSNADEVQEDERWTATVWQKTIMPPNVVIVVGLVSNKM